VTGVLAVPAIAKVRFRVLGLSQRIVKFSIGKKSGIGGDSRAVELKAQLGVEIRPQTLFTAFTHRTLRFSELPNRFIPIQKCNYSTKSSLAAKLIWEMWVEVPFLGNTHSPSSGRTRTCDLRVILLTIYI
jgi:hypothetical protein